MNKTDFKEKIKNIIFGLRIKVTLIVALSVFIAFLGSYIVSLISHSFMTVNKAIESNRMLGRTLAIAINQEVAVSIYDEGSRIYYGLSEEAKADPTSSKYLSRYTQLKNEDYLALQERLTRIARESELEWIDLRIIDEENDRYVYLLDTEQKPNMAYAMGDWNYFEDEVVTFVIDDSDEITAREISILTEKRNQGRHLSSKAEDGFVFCTLAPFYRPETHELIGYIGIGQEVAVSLKDYKQFTDLFKRMSIGMMIVVLVFTALLIGRQVVRPIRRLTKAARKYAATQDKLNSEPVFKNTGISRHDEIGLLADSMSDMETEMVSYMKNLTELTARQERMDAELGVAERIQMSMLPDKFAGKEGFGDITISSYIKPARLVGGDFYDYFMIDEDHIGLSIADVSGKGVPAALFMAICKTLLKSTAMEETSPAGIAKRVNTQLCENNPEMMFVTLWFGIYSISAHTITYINAGHEYPCVYRRETDRYELLIEDHDPVMGFMPELEFEEREITLKDGDRFFVYTDGVPEATNTDEKLYGTDRMTQCLNADTDKTGDTAIRALCDDIEMFLNGAEQFDDITIMLIERTEKTHV